MPIGRGRRSRDDKLEPTEQSDTKKLPDESDTDHTAFSDCSSEDGSSNKQSLNDANSSVDSGHDSGCMSTSSTLSDVTYSGFSSVNGSTSDSSDSEHPLTSLSSNDSDYASTASGISDVSSSPKSDSVARKDAIYPRTDNEKKMESSFSTDTFVDKVQHESLDHKVQRYSDERKSMERHAIPHAPHKEEHRNIEKIKRKITTHISKHLLRNTEYADDTDYTDVIKRMSLIVEKLERNKQYLFKYLVKEAEEELIKLGTTGNAADSIATIKSCLDYLKNELAAGRLTDDHLANYLVKKLPGLILLTVKNMALEKEINNSVYGKAEMIDDFRLAPFELDVSDVNNHQGSDDQYLEYLCESMGKGEKYSALKEIKDCKQFQNQMYRQDLVVMFSSSGSSDGNGDQGDQADNQGNGTNIPADIPGQLQAAQENPQVAELPENIDTCNQQQDQEYSPMLAIQEEGARGVQEKVFEAPKLFELPEKSELVTHSSHPFHTVYCVEDQHVSSEYQCFSKILAAKGVTIETIMRLIHTSATCVQYHISELLYSISVIIDNAEQVFSAENVCRWLPAVVEQALIMMNERPIPVTENGADIPLATSWTSDSYVRNRSHDGGLRYFPPETTSSFDQSMAPVDAVNNFQVTTNPLQDSDNGMGDVNVVDIRMYEFHRSAEACNVIEIEDFQLRGYCCCMCGISMCEGERIAEEMRTLLQNARCCVCIEEITSSVNFNARQNCIHGMLRAYIPQEIMQRNVALGCPACVTRCQIFYASHIFNPVTQCSINSFINLQCRNLFSNVYGHLSNTNYPTALITSEGPISFVNVQNLIDRLCSEFSSLLSNHSILQPLTQQATSRYLSSCHEYMQTFLSSLPHGILQNASSKLSVSMTVMPDGVLIDMDQLKNGLLSSRVALRCRDSITYSSLYLPPVNAFSNIPIMVNWTVTIQSSLSCLQVGFDGVGSVDPVEAVNLHDRESLVTALQPTYGHHGDEESSNSVQPINSLVENPIFDPNDWHKTNRADIYDYFPEENSPYVHQPSDNDTIINDNQINCEPEEATISDDSSKPESKI